MGGGVSDSWTPPLFLEPSAGPGECHYQQWPQGGFNPNWKSWDCAAAGCGCVPIAQSESGGPETFDTAVRLWGSRLLGGKVHPCLHIFFGLSFPPGSLPGFLSHARHILVQCPLLGGVGLKCSFIWACVCFLEYRRIHCW